MPLDLIPVDDKGMMPQRLAIMAKDDGESVVYVLLDVFEGTFDLVSLFVLNAERKSLQFGKVLRQAVGPGPGPGCVSTLDCACKNGSREACEQLATVAKASKRPKVPPAPKSGPDPILPPNADQVPSEPDDDTKDRCAAYYAKCVAAGGQNLPGRHKSESLCGSCLAYCTSNGFWPEAIYTWNGVRRVCLGQ